MFLNIFNKCDVYGNIKYLYFYLSLSLSHSVFFGFKNLKWSLAIKFFVKTKIETKIKNSVSILHYACLHSRLQCFSCIWKEGPLTWNRNFKVSIKKSLKARNKNIKSKKKKQKRRKNLNLIYLFGENWLHKDICIRRWNEKDI